MAENYTKFNFIATASGAISNVGLNLVLIPRYGGFGAAIATLISQAIAMYFTCLLYEPIWKTGRMMTMALLIPTRINQNINYLNNPQANITQAGLGQYDLSRFSYCRNAS